MDNLAQAGAARNSKASHPHTRSAEPTPPRQIDSRAPHPSKDQLSPRQQARDWVRFKVAKDGLNAPTVGELLLLYEFVCWVPNKRTDFVISPRVRTDASGTGILDILGITHDYYSQLVHRLRSKGLIDVVKRGTYSRRTGRRQYSQVRLLVRGQLKTEFQPSLLASENLEHEQVDSMTGGHEVKVDSMTGGHEVKVDSMTGGHEDSDLSYYKNPNRTENPKDPSSSPPPDDDDDCSKQKLEQSGLCSNEFIAHFVHRANQAYDLTTPLLEVAFSYLGGGSRFPDDAFTDDLIATVHRKRPEQLVPYMRAALEDRLRKGAEPEAQLRPYAEPEAPAEAERAQDAAYDWTLLHEFHSGAPSANEARRVWDEALVELQLQVARPAFETWLADTSGEGITDAEFVVGTSNQFVSEMLEHRMFPLIERAVEKVCGEPRSLRFIVVPDSVDHADCPLCDRSTA